MYEMVLLMNTDPLIVCGQTQKNKTKFLIINIFFHLSEFFFIFEKMKGFPPPSFGFPPSLLCR